MTRRQVLGAALAASLAGTPPALAELGPGDPPRHDQGGRPLLPEGPFRLQCWQNGVKIIEEDELYDLTMGMPNLAEAITAQGAERNRRAMLFSSNPYTTCFVRKQR